MDLELIDRWEAFKNIDRRALFEEHLEGLLAKQKVDAIYQYVYDGEREELDETVLESILNRKELVPDA